MSQGLIQPPLEQVEHQHLLAESLKSHWVTGHYFRQLSAFWGLGLPVPVH